VLVFSDQATNMMQEGADPKVSSNRISTFLLFATVAAAPLPFGSTNLQIAFWCIVLGIAAIAASPRGLRFGQFVLLGLAGVVIAAYGLVLHEQLATHPWFATPHPLWREASEALGIPIEPSVSIARHQPFFALGVSLADMLALICSFIICTDRNRARQLLKVVAWSGAAYAIYGIAAFLIGPTKIPLTSTFVNRNVAAVYFGSCAIVWLLLFCERIRGQFRSGSIQWRKVLSGLFSDKPAAVVVPFSMLLVCLTAMFATVSRAGILVSLIMLVIAVTALFYRDLPRRSGVFVVVAVGAAVALLLLQVMGASVSGRLLSQGLGDEGRRATYWSTWHMIRDHPWVGTGLGTFAWSLPAYRSANISMWGIYDRAHSTVLEMAAELGLPFTGLVVIAWIIVLAVLVRGVWIRRRDVVVPVTALSVAALALVHSLIDFSLQIPGYAIVVFALLGAGLSQSFSSRGKNTALGPAELSHLASASRLRR
jgi:O-antigen ligase